MGKIYGQGLPKNNGIVYGISEANGEQAEFLILDYYKKKTDNPQREIVTILSKMFKEDGNDFPAQEEVDNAKKRAKELLEFMLVHMEAEK